MIVWEYNGVGSREVDALVSASQLCTSMCSGSGGFWKSGLQGRLLFGRENVLGQKENIFE